MTKYLAAVTTVLLVSCQGHDPVSDATPEARRAVARVHVGMEARQMLNYLIPVASSGPAIKNTGEHTYRYYFVLDPDHQVWFEMDNSEGRLAIGPSMPNGIVVAVGQIERKTVWRLKYQDSNEIE